MKFLYVGFDTAENLRLEKAPMAIRGERLRICNLGPGGPVTDHRIQRERRRRPHAVGNRPETGPEPPPASRIFHENLCFFESINHFLRMRESVCKGKTKTENVKKRSVQMKMQVEQKYQN